MENNEYGKCDICEAPRKLIFRRINLTSGDHVLVDSAQFCETCWRGSRRDICDAACLADSK